MKPFQKNKTNEELSASDINTKLREIMLFFRHKKNYSRYIYIEIQKQMSCKERIKYVDKYK